MESASVLSTYCRHCSGHIRMATAEALFAPRVRVKAGVLEKAVALAVTALRRAAAARPGPGGGVRRAGLAAAPVPGQPVRRPKIPMPPMLSPTAEGGMGTFRGTRPGGRREVVCFDCRAVSKAAARATSTQCANCGTFIDLKDVEIRERSTQRIRTRGSVTIHKKGALLGTAVHCGNLIVEGTVAGSIYAQDTVEFRTGAKILGEVRCRHLLVERRVKVAGLQPVHVETLELQGELTARVFAKGLVRIRRHGRFEGGLQAPGVRLDAGGALVGPMMINARREYGTPRAAATEDSPASPGAGAESGLGPEDRMEKETAHGEVRPEDAEISREPEVPEETASLENRTGMRTGSAWERLLEAGLPESSAISLAGRAKGESPEKGGERATGGRDPFPGTPERL